MQAATGAAISDTQIKAREIHILYRGMYQTVWRGPAGKGCFILGRSMRNPTLTLVFMPVV